MHLKFMSELKDSAHSTVDDGPLGIYIITYNRAPKLRETLEYIDESVIRKFPITVLDNCSNDNTVEVVNSFIRKNPNIKLVSNRFNIGLGANFLKTFELSNYKYTWVLCDDDFISATEITDILQVIDKGEVDLIHVGAHAQNEWPQGGGIFTPKQLLNDNYPYFKFSSFIPCNIFRTEIFVNKHIVKAYENIIYAYPHMPFLFHLYETNANVYISKQPLVVAKPSDSGYSHKVWYYWWIHTCELLHNKSDVRLAYLNQWNDIGRINKIEGIKSLCYASEITDDNDYIKQFISKYFTIKDRIIYFAIKKDILPIFDKLYWFKVWLLKKIK
jgi:glycosyltransferase involved in cell wall biosynthesis